MSAETVNAIVAGTAVAALAVIALAAVIAAVALWRAGRDVRRVTGSLNDLVGSIGSELPPTLKELRSAATNLSRLSDELQPRLERIDGLLDESHLTMQSLRATAEAAEDIVRGPAAAVDRARRTMRAAGEGLARGADRLVKGVQGRR